MNTQDSLMARAPHICYTQLDDHDLAVLNPDNECLYHFNASAVDLWLHLTTPRTALELAHMLAEKYSGPAETYQHDVLEWINESRAHGLLITIENEPINTHE